MKQIACTLLAVTTLTFSTLYAQQPNWIAQELESRQQQSQLLAVQDMSLFDVREEVSTARAGSGLERYLLADLSISALQQVQRSLNQVLNVEVPYFDEVLVLELYRVDDSPAVVRTSDGSVSHELGLHYRGILRGDRSSLASISIYDDEIVGLISTAEYGNIVIGEWEDKDSHIIYNDRDVIEKQTFECEARTVPGQFNEIRDEIHDHSRSAAAGCTDIYLEIGYDVYTSEGSSRTNVQSLISGIFNQVKTIYANEGISINMSEMYIWTTADPYSGSTNNHLDQFMSKRPSYNGDLAHLITVSNDNGGVAYVDVLCSRSFGYGYSDISGSYARYPSYSWSVNVLAHELGHNFGSPHTHACAWGPSKDKALDDCYPTTDGNCSRGPKPTNGGTIMSYCHLTSAGVNFSNGFGTEPGNLIRSRVNAASCLGNCDGGGSTCDLFISDFDVQAASCGQENGQVKINVSGATSSTTYTLDGKSSSSSTFTDLAAGTYTVIVTNSSSCEREAEVTVPSSDGSISLSADVQAASCDQANGEVVLSARGGDSPYKYTLGSKTQSSATFDNLEAGTYAASVEDDQGCIAAISVVVEASSGPALSSNIDHTSCGENNGRITLSASGGSGSFIYTLGSQSNSTGIFDDLKSGTYSAMVVDGSDCSTTASLVVNSSEAIVSEVAVTATECGEDNGKLEVSASGGQGTLRYSIGGGFQSSPLFTRLSAGDYKVRVRDQAFCETESLEEVESSQSYDAVLESTDTYCGEDNGTLSIQVSNGTGPFSYKIDNGQFTDQTEYKDLESGDYQVTIRDQSGCETKMTAEIKSSSPIESEITVSHTSCGENNGRLSIDARGGVGDLQIKINGVSQTARNFAELPHGNYEVQITDKVGCVVVHQETINSSDPVSLATVVEGTTCNEENGSIQLEASGSEGPYLYRVDNGAFSDNSLFTGIVAGSHAVSVRDQAGCEVTKRVDVASSVDAELEVKVLHTTCSLPNGALEIEIKGGTAPFRYLLNGQEESAGTISNLQAGNYEVILRDAVGCEGTAAVQIEASEDIEITTEVIATTCGQENGLVRTAIVAGRAPFKYLLDDEERSAEMTSIAAGLHQLKVIDADNCLVSQDIEIAPSVGIDLAVQSRSTTCGQNNGEITVEAAGGTGSLTFSLGEDFTDQSTYAALPPQAYLVQVKDEVGCVVEDTVDIKSSTNPEANLIVQDTRCGEDNGSITLEIRQGVAPYVIEVNGQIAESEILQNLTPGEYQYIVTDIHGCITSSSASLQGSSAPTFVASTVKANCYKTNGEVHITASSGVGPYRYSLGEGFQSDNQFVGVDSGTYLVTVLDSAECGVDQLVTVEYDPQYLAPELPEATPLCDGEATVLSTGLTSELEIVWSKDGTILDLHTPDLTVEDRGTYQASITYHEGCVLTATSYVEVHSRPAQSLPSSLTICQGDIFAIDRNSEEESYAWSNGDTGHEINFLTSGVYTLTTTNQYFCSNESRIDVEVIPFVELPQPAYSEEFTCSGSTFEIAGDGAAEYAWFVGDQAEPFSHQKEIAVLFDSTTRLKLIGTNQCFADTAVVLVQAWQDNSSLSSDTTVVEGAPLSIILQGGNDIAWASEYTLSCSDCPTTHLRPTETGKIFVDYLDDHGCERSGEVAIDIIALDEVIPELVNVITPNQDGYNDKLEFEGSEYLLNTGLRIFDQLGQEIYASDSYENDWGGRWDGRLLPEGVYFYIVSFSLDDRVLEFDSPLTIVRSEIK